MPKQGAIRRAKLSYEKYGWDEKKERLTWQLKFKSINPLKKRGGKPFPLGEREIWNIAEEVVRRLVKGNG